MNPGEVEHIEQFEYHEPELLISHELVDENEQRESDFYENMDRWSD